MSGLPYQPTPKMSYHQTPQVSNPTRTPPLTSATSYQQSGEPTTYQGSPQTPSASYQPTSSRYQTPEQTSLPNRTAASSTTYQKSGSTYQKVPETAHPVRQGSGVSPSQVATAKNQISSAARPQKLSRTVPGIAGQAQQATPKRGSRNDRRRSEENKGDCCPIL